MSTVRLRWPDGRSSNAAAGCSWLEAAQAAGVSIPTGCLGGSCGACEIEVNGELLRACISNVPNSQEPLQVELASDPYW
jgi:ferredoxin